VDDSLEDESEFAGSVAHPARPSASVRATADRAREGVRRMALT
jgi:hypothetical protein